MERALFRASRTFSCVLLVTCPACGPPFFLSVWRSRNEMSSKVGAVPGIMDGRRAPGFFSLILQGYSAILMQFCIQGGMHRKIDMPVTIHRMKKIIIQFIQKFPENLRPIIVTCVLSVARRPVRRRVPVHDQPAFFENLSFFRDSICRTVRGCKLYSYNRVLTPGRLPAERLQPRGCGQRHPPGQDRVLERARAYEAASRCWSSSWPVILSIGGGNSLGREGPSVYIGQRRRLPTLDGAFGARRSASGAAPRSSARRPGLAAAFNTPLAAITFVIEEIVGDLNSRFLGRVVLSSVIGAFVVYALLGRQPAFSLPSIENIILASLRSLSPWSLWSLRWPASCSSASLCAGGCDMKKQKRVPAWLLPVLGGLVDLGHRLRRVPGHRARSACSGWATRIFPAP